MAFATAAHAAIDTWSNTGGSSWTSTTNWSPTSPPATTDLAVFAANPTSGGSGIGINFGGTLNNTGAGADNEAVGAIEISAARTSNNIAIGDSATTSGTFTLNGVSSVNGYSNVVLDDESSSVNLTIEPSNTGPGTMSVALGDSTNNEIVQDGGGTITVSCNIGQVASGAQLTIGGAGGGSVSLTGNNTFSGGFSILGSEADISSDASLGASSNNITINGGRLGSNSGLVFTILSTRNIYLGSAAGTSVSVKGATGDLTYNGVFQDLTTGGILVKQGAGTLDIGGANTYTGATSINNGTIQLTTGNNRLPTGTLLSLGQASSVNLGTLDLNGFSQQVAGLQSTVGTNSTSGTSNAIINTSATPATLTVNGNGNYTYGSGTLTNTGVINGAISMVFNGGGTETLGGASGYTGSTTVNNANLVVSGSLNGTSSLSVTSGTLQLGSNNGINHTNPAPLSLSTGVLNTAGNKASFADLTATGASTIDLGVGSTSSLLNFADSHNDIWSGTLTIADWNGSFSGGGPDEIFFGSSASGLTSTQLGDINFLNPTIGGVAETGDYSAAILSTGEVVAVSAVPEPATWATVLSGLAALILFQSRRDRRSRSLIG